MNAWKRLPKAPAEGWISVLLVTIMTLSIAWSLDDAAWVLGRERYTDFLAYAVLWGVLIGFIGAKVGWGRWPTYLLGSLIAALAVPLYVGASIAPEGTWLVQYQATAGSVIKAYDDLAIRGLTVTQQYGHFLFVLGLFTWATAMFTSFATFGHRRPLNAIILVGLVLVGNMSFTFRDQLTFLVIFSLAALFLLIRFHAFDEESEWIRRRIGDPAAVSSIYLRGGTAFIAIAVIGSLVLTETASSKPLAGALRGIGGQVVDWGRDFQRFFPTGGANRAFGISFGATAQISGQWNFDPGQAVTIEFLEPEDDDHYWRAVTYDEFEFTSWKQRVRIGVDRAPGQDLLVGTGDEVTPEGRREVTFRVFPDGFRDASILSPATPVTVDQGARVSLVGQAGFFATIDRGGEGPYAVKALVPVVGDPDNGLTANKLRVAGTNYPQEIRELYLDVPEGVVPPGGDADRMLDQVVASVEDPANPYDVAEAMRDFLRSSAFTYKTDVLDLPCDGLSTVECFARYRQGYCQYYATTMAVLLRLHDIPTRLASGFLPGTRTGDVERIDFSRAHAWVEVYFPGYGWVLFDPTGGGLPGQVAPLPAGEPVESAPPAVATRPPGDGFQPTLGPFEEGEFGPGVAGPTQNDGTAGLLIVVTFLLVLIVGGLAFLAWQRGSRGDMTPDRAYGSLTRLAGRLGFAPRPTQTVYEYAGALGDVLPLSRPEIQTVAQAKVEVAYGRRALGADRMAALREAQRRLRVGLLRLLFRRVRRRR